MRVLVTNDDGVDSPGLAALARAVHAAGHDTVVVAPLDERSGAAAAIGALGPGTRLKVSHPQIDGLHGTAGVEVYGLEGPPALCVVTARLGAFGDQPDLVVSGINRGLNTGRSILHSGTVGAALSAANQGISGVAVSSAGADPVHWETAAELAVEALDWVSSAPLRTVVNLNVPDEALADVRGVCWGVPAALGEWQAVVVGAGTDLLELDLRRTEVELPPESDTALVAAGYAAVTLLNGPRAADWAPVAEHIERRLVVRTGS
ncbi:MAG: 5'/3'-nucleotidase SurE [Acidimicrobiia bacterium]|nr:5'/3'-nucleotidase SurE [Acidimicrobiia bacterium]